MTGGEVGSQNCSTQLDGLVVVDYAIHLDAGKGALRSEESIDSRSQCLSVSGTGYYLRAGKAFEFCQTASVIEMRVAVEKIFHIADLKTEIGDIFLNQWGRLRQPA